MSTPPDATRHDRSGEDQRQIRTKSCHGSRGFGCLGRGSRCGTSGSEATGAVAQPAESETATHAAVIVRIRVVVVGRCVVNVSVWSVLSVLSAAREPRIAGGPT